MDDITKQKGGDVSCIPSPFYLCIIYLIIVLVSFFTRYVAVQLFIVLSINSRISKASRSLQLTNLNMQSHFRCFDDHLKLSIVLFVLFRFCSTSFLTPRPTIRVATAYTLFVAAWSFPGCCIEEKHQRTGGESSRSRRGT